jgi:hypothetical protein
MNPFLIEQTRDESLLAISLHQNAEICGIRLAHANASAISPEIAMKKDIAVSMDVKATRIGCEGESLVIEVGFSFKGTQKPEQKKCPPVISVESTFQVTYRLKPGFEPTDDQVRAFKDGNAIFNCWPYCRHYVQEQVLQMGYPPVTLPFLRVVTKPTKTRSAKIEK